MSHTLITLAYSHYNDRARWALLLASEAFDERRYMPPFSLGAVALYSRGKGGRPDAASTRFSAPYLITADGDHIPDSGDILRWADARGELGLFESLGALELSDRFHDRVGPHTRRVAYGLVGDDRATMRKLAYRNVSATQARLFVAALPVAKRVLKRALRVTPQGVERSKTKLREEADFVEGLLADGRPYLTGDQFSAADLTLAALLAPALSITPEEGYGACLPRPDELDGEAAAWVSEWRSRPIGEYALRLYRDHRLQLRV